MRIVFCGTPEFAVPPLRALLAEPDFRVEAVITQPDRPRGRGHAVEAPPVKRAALGAGLPIFQPEHINSDEGLQILLGAAPDAVVIIAYGQIIRQRLLDVPRLGWINLHASLLPKYRGAAPIHWAIVNGEACTGLTTMRIDAGLDSGPILEQSEIAIGADETAPELTARMAEAGGALMISTLRKLAAGTITPRAQDAALATHAPILKKEDGRISWNLSAMGIYNRIRGMQPWPGAFTTFRGQSCHVWGKPEPGVSNAAASATTPSAGTIEKSGGALLVMCGDGTRLRVDAVQLQGRKRVAAAEFVNGARLAPSESFV